MSSEWSNDEFVRRRPGRRGPLELQELEDELCRLGGVLAVRVVGDRIGRPIEVHVLADNSKPAKQTVRDVALGRADHVRARARSPHRVGRPARHQRADEPVASDPAARAETRARVGSVHFEARVCARDGAGRAGRRETREHTGSPRARSRRSARPQLVAAATLDAVRQVEPAADAVHVSSADIARVGETPRRSGHRRLRRAAARARRLRVGGRAPRPRRRRRPRAARRDQPSASRMEPRHALR